MHYGDTPCDADVGDRNIERLLETAYRPEAVDPDFAAGLTEQLCSAAADLADTRPADHPPADAARWRPVRRRLGALMAVAAGLAGVALVFHARQPRPEGPERPAEAAPVVEGYPAGARPGEAPVGLTPRPRPAAPAAVQLAVGASLSTQAGERRRVTLADGSVLYLNQNTAVRQTAHRRLELDRGEVYLEVAPRA